MEKNNNEKKSRYEQVQEITAKLEKGVIELFNSDKYKEYLSVMSRFSEYSFNNSLLIALQNPECTAVAGYKAWQRNFNRHVKAGSKAIKIIAPCPMKKTVEEVLKDEFGRPVLDQNGNPKTQEVEKKFLGFRVENVFALEDTEGQELPEIVHILDQAIENYDELMDVIQKVSPVPIHIQDISGNANGYYHLAERAIYIKESLPDAQKVKTSLHELAHFYLHDRVQGIDKEATEREREVAAESVAFTVSQWLHLDTSSYSFGYIGGWAGSQEIPQLKEKMEVIRKTANEIISSIEEELLYREIEKAETIAYQNVSGYLLIQKNDSGYHYELYSPDYENILKADINNVEMGMNEVIGNIMNQINSKESNWHHVNVEALRTKIQEKPVEQMKEVQEETITHKNIYKR